MSAADSFARELHGLLHPEEYPPGSPHHDPKHSHWDGFDPQRDDPSAWGPLSWDASLLEQLDKAINQRLEQEKAARALSLSIAYTEQACLSVGDALRQIHGWIVRVECRDGSTFPARVGDLMIAPDGLQKLTLHPITEQCEPIAGAPLVLDIYDELARIVVH